MAHGASGYNLSVEPAMCMLSLAEEGQPRLHSGDYGMVFQAGYLFSIWAEGLFQQDSTRSTL